MNGTIDERAAAPQRDFTTHVSQRRGQSPSSIGWVRPPAGHSSSIARTPPRDRARRLPSAGVNAPTSSVDAHPTLGCGTRLPTATSSGGLEFQAVRRAQRRHDDFKETYDRQNVEIHPTKRPGHRTRRGPRQHRHARSVENRRQRTLDHNVSEVPGRSGEFALRRLRGRYHHGGHRTRVVRRRRSRSGSSENEPRTSVSLTASGCNATPSPSRVRAPTRQQSTSRIHNGNEARLPGHLAKGTLRQLDTPDERCQGKSAESYPLWGWSSNWHQRGVPLASPLERIRLLKSAISGCPSPLGALRRPTPLAVNQPLSSVGPRRRVAIRHSRGWSLTRRTPSSRLLRRSTSVARRGPTSRICVRCRPCGSLSGTAVSGQQTASGGYRRLA
jgi:hypothetical protein